MLVKGATSRVVLLWLWHISMDHCDSFNHCPADNDAQYTPLNKHCVYCLPVEHKVYSYRILITGAGSSLLQFIIYTI